MMQARRKRGAGGALAPPQFLAKQLTLSQPGGQIIPTTVLRAPPDGPEYLWKYENFVLVQHFLKSLEE